ncbi:GMC oxidoreductase [Nostocoides sp. HKS02]|uniref:GMC oxidoreductase n=1 Tax=Nostocoides sp. HKS02 TaxID=1813880 RepID=UPI0012B49804|nr:GMC oxidoreductase [Tetrasphaera sp. HKS02]QGN57725.1 FAD-binding protein [Tetrasphaera sp. HKS02]
MSSDRLKVIVIGSGPTGAVYARRLLERSDSVSVLMVEAGPALSDPLGMNVRNIADKEEQTAAKLASQGPAAGRAGMAGIPTGGMEGTVTARQGTHLVGRAAEGSTGMPAAAAATCVGGQGAHWTCATPRPIGTERIDFLEAELDDLLDEAERLLHTTHEAFSGAPQAAALLGLVADEFAADGLLVQPLPVAGDPRADGSMRWSGTDVVLGELATPGAKSDRFELRTGTLAVRLIVEDDTVVGAILRDVATGAETQERADAVVVAADALRTPQLLWASGIRPEALGRYLTEHPLIFGVVAVKEGLLPPVGAAAAPVDPVRVVVGIRFDQELHPFHAQLIYSPVCPIPLPPDSPFIGNPGGYVGMGWGVRKWPRAEDRLLFVDDEPDENQLPGIRIAYEVTQREEAELDHARDFLDRAAAALGTFIDGMPVVMPPGSSLHYMGTVRMGAHDDGTSVCDPDSRVWGVNGLVLAGNGLIPTANSCNPTLTSVALAVRGADALIERLATTQTRAQTEEAR